MPLTTGLLHVIVSVMKRSNHTDLSAIQITITSEGIHKQTFSQSHSFILMNKTIWNNKNLLKMTGEHVRLNLISSL